MRSAFILTALAYASSSTAAINWTLGNRNPNPSEDENDAYRRITAAMDAAVSRYNTQSNGSLNKNLFVTYVPGVPTADGNFNGGIRFGSGRENMNERVALHEISHTLGIGQTQAFNDRCGANNWPSATALLRSWDGPDARINCGGGHIWPYGLNFDNEFSQQAADRHVQLIQAMVRDGLQG